MPLALTHPLLTSPYISPTTAYTFLSVRTAAWNWEAPLATLMRWIRASLYQTCPGVKSLPPLNMAKHITVSRQKLQIQLVLCIPSGPVTLSLAYIVHQAQQVAQSAPARKKILAERWDLQASSLYRLTDVQFPEELPEIWHTIAPLTKEKARPAFDIVSRENARALICKIPLSHERSGITPPRNSFLH